MDLYLSDEFWFLISNVFFRFSQATIRGKSNTFTFHDLPFINHGQADISF